MAHEVAVCLADLEKLAFLERQTTSAMAGILIEEALKVRGYLIEGLKQTPTPERSRSQKKPHQSHGTSFYKLFKQVNC